MLRMTGENRTRRLAATIVAVGLGVGVLTSCGAPAGVPESSPTASSPSVEPTESPTFTSSESPTEVETPTDPPSEEPSEEPSESEEATDDGSERPPVLDEKATGRDLTMSDFFSAPESWQDGRFDVAGQRGLSGIRGPLNYCRSDEDDHSILELRLANRFKKISMKVGQSDDSGQSDAVLNVRLVGNGKYIDSVKVPFNKIDSFSAPVSDVNALKIEVWMGGDHCGSGTVGAVLIGLRLE